MTRTNKPYLSLLLTDGKQEIRANVWDWPYSTCPEKNTILDIYGEVGEFNGTPQLTIKSFKVNTELTLVQFMPSEDFSIEDYIGKVYLLIHNISNPLLSSLTMKIFDKYETLWRVQPGAKKVHHAVVAGNLKHSVDVALKVQALLPLIPCNGDLALAGALLHDLGKLWTYHFDGICIEFTQEGYLLDHLVIGVRVLEQFRDAHNGTIIDLLQHIIVSHHNKLEWGSPVAPKCIEAWLVHYCDDLDAKSQILKELDETTKDTQYTAKSFALDNKYMLSRHTIENMLGEMYVI